jgi:TetR/AcrR family transcriptional regulator
MATVRDSSSLILGAACTEFAEHGFAGARVARIAARANVNKQLIFYYFGSKAGLYAAATGSAPAEALPPDDGSPVERFRELLNRLESHLLAHPELTTALADRETAHGMEGPGRRFLEPAARAIGATISRGQGMGYFRDDVDPQVAARQTVVLLAGFHVLGPSLDDRGDAASWGALTADLLLRALAW